MSSESVPAFLAAIWKRCVKRGREEGLEGRKRKKGRGKRKGERERRGEKEERERRRGERREGGGGRDE